MQFVTSPKCQHILNEIVYYEWPHWQNTNLLTKLAWSFFQLVMVSVSIAFYIPVRLARKRPCCNKDHWRWWKFREMYEHPYCKFVNHNMWYLLFLVFIFLTTFAQAFGAEITGFLTWQGERSSGAGMAQWLSICLPRRPPANVARVRFPDSASYVG